MTEMNVKVGAQIFSSSVANFIQCLMLADHPGSEDPGGGYLVYLSDGDVPFFRVSFSPIFSRTGYQKKANFLEQVVKTCQKRKFCYNGLTFSPIFVFLSMLFSDFF